MSLCTMYNFCFFRPHAAFGLELICSRRLQQAELNSKTVFLILSLMADRCCHRSPSSCSPTPKSFYFAQGHVQQIEFPLNEISLFYLWYPFSALCKQTCFFLKIQNPRQNPLSTGCTKSNSIKIRESLFTSLLKKRQNCLQSDNFIWSKISKI